MRWLCLDQPNDLRGVFEMSARPRVRIRGALLSGRVAARCFSLLMLLGCLPGAAVAQSPSENGAAPNPLSATSIAAPDTPIDGQIDGPWLEFAFFQVGVPATGCAPADPSGPGCAPSSAGNSIFVGAPPWTFTAPAAGVTLTVTDAFLTGDQFEIFDFGASIGLSSVVVPSGDCGDDPVPCLANPATSSGVFQLAAGPHSLEISAVASPFLRGAAYFRLDGVPFVEVDVDIKPGSDPNSINPMSQGVIAVAILGSEIFDVAD